MTNTDKTLAYKPQHTSVMILAAGEGKRMLPLTRNTPKPLLKIGSYSLIEHHLIRLKTLGFKDIIINIAYHAEQIKQTLGNGNKYQLNITYSDESSTGALETAGGICNALPLINSDPFLVINSDIWTDFDFTTLLTPLPQNGRLVLVDNPDHNLDGDFCLSNDGTLQPLKTHSPTATFSGIGLYRKKLFSGLDKSHHALAPVLHQAIQQQQLQAVLHQGGWNDIGTPQRLADVNQIYASTA